VQDSYHAHLLMQVLLSNLVRARATRGCVTGRATSLGAAAATKQKRGPGCGAAGLVALELAVTLAARCAPRDRCR
jgi:hypothetical protein